MRGNVELKKSFKVEVDGKPYVVEIEELDGEKSKPLPPPTAPVSRPPPPVVRPARTAEPTPPPPPREISSGPAGPGVVKAPLTGVVLSMKRSVGESVKVGDVLLILEAMKMENEVYAPKSGTIKKIAVSEKQTVTQGDLLFEII